MVLRHKETGAAASQEVVVHEIAHTDVSLHARAIALHKIANGMAAEMRNNSNLRIAAAGRVEKKPSDEGQPQTAKTSAHEEFEDAIQDEENRDDLSDTRGQLGGAHSILVDPPDDRAKHASAIERIARNHIKDGERDVDVTQP